MYCAEFISLTKLFGGHLIKEVLFKRNFSRKYRHIDDFRDQIRKHAMKYIALHDYIALLISQGVNVCYRIYGNMCSKHYNS